MILRILKHWLRKRLGVVINVIPSPFLRIVRDGTLISQILLSYNLITEDEQQSIEETDDNVIAYENYNNYIKTWLNRINIELTEKDIYEIVNGDGTTAITLFYDIYLELEREKPRMKLKDNIQGPFTVRSVKEKAFELPEFAPNALCEPLIKEWDVINWQKDHLDAVARKYMRSRKEYDEYLEKKNLKPAICVHHSDREDYHHLPQETDESSFDLNYQELLHEQDDYANMELFKPNAEEAERILKKIKRKKKHQRDLLKTKQQLEQEFLLKLKDEMNAESKQNFDKIVCEKILKQSKHEKELAEKIMEIRKQKEQMRQNKIKWIEAEQKRKEEEFIKAMFLEDLEGRLRFHEERQQLIAEHKRLYEIKMQKKALKHEKICRDIVEDFVDLAIKQAEYKETYGLEPDQHIKDEWATLFIKQQKILDDIDLDTMRNPPEEMSLEIQEIFQKQQLKQDVLDTQDFLNYIQHLKEWSILQLENVEDEEKILLGMNCLGYAIHRCLLKKYPLPIPEKPQLCPDIEVAVCATLEDTSKLPYFKRLLALKNIVVIELEDCIKFCIEAYEIEKKTEFDDPFPDANLKEIGPRQAGDKKGKGKGKKDKGKKKDKKDKKKKGDKKSKKSKDKPEAVTIKEEKQSQTPRLFPWEYNNLSNRARLGKFVIGEQELGNKIDDKTLVEMFIEYLTAIPNLKGWVLINFPTNFQQAAFLEMVLSGKPVPQEYYEEILNKESLTSVQLKNVVVSSTVDAAVSLNVEKSISLEIIDENEKDLNPTPVSQSLNILEPLKERESLNDTVKHVSIESELDFVAKKPTSRSLYSFTKPSEITFNPKDIDKQTYERVSNLLPDLVQLAFSSEFFSKAEVERKFQEHKEEQFACGCKCAEDLDNFIENQMELSLTDQKDIEDILQIVIDYVIENENVLPELEIVQYDDLPIPRTIPEDPGCNKRKSKILQNPKPLENEEYQTVLTAYIKTIPKEEFSDDDDLIPTYFAQVEKINGLEKFYCDQECYYLLEFDEIDSETIKCLAKMVIGDYSLPLKSSFELFGERYLEAQFEVGDNIITKKGKGKEKKKKKEKKGKKKKEGSETTGKSSKKGKGKKDTKSKSSKSTKSGKGSKKGKKDKKGKKGKKEEKVEEIPKTFEDKEIQFPYIEEEEPEPEPKPGEPNWEYITIPIPQNLELNLALFWENFENNYVNDFKQFFTNRRTIIHDFVPYLGQVRDVMYKFIKREDTRSYYLHEFQKTLNEIDLNLRQDQATKNQLLENIMEFKGKLLGISDTKMEESEQRRRDFIEENWIFRQFCELVYNGKIAFQLEIDRFVDTLQFISDYYVSIIKKNLDNKQEFHKEVLPSEPLDPDDEFNRNFLEIDYELNRTLFHVFIDDLYKTSKIIVDNQAPFAEDVLKTTKKLFEKPVNEEKAKKTKKKKPKEPKFELDEDVKEESDRIFDEWLCALNGEIKRINYQLDLLQMEQKTKLDGLIKWIRELFIDIYNTNKILYDNEMTTTFLACDLLRKCVEDEKILTPELCFNKNQLIQIKIEVFPNVEDYNDGKFSLEQLEYMYHIFLDLANDGMILQSTFLLLLQDILYRDEGDPIPEIWRNLTPKLLDKFNAKFFNQFEYIQWKDFIVCNLLIEFPTHDQLLETRKKFIEYDTEFTEIVTFNNFQEIDLWFQNEDVKQFLFKMYCIGGNKMNWTAFLLDFCKDFDRIEGFTKALELALGRKICKDPKMGEDYILDIMEQNRIYAEKLEAENEETLDLAKKAINVAVDNMIETNLASGDEEQGLIITEITENDSKKQQQQRKLDQKMSLIGVKSNIFAVKSKSTNEFDIESGEFLLDLRYSDSEIGFESRENTNFAHFLPLEAVQVVVKAALMSNQVYDHSEMNVLEKIYDIYTECKNEDFNNAVLTHEFLNCEKLAVLFSEINKFYAGNPVKIIREVVRSVD